MGIGKQLYLFEEGHAGMKALLGGKGANIAEMVRMGLPVPPGFIITTETCNEYLDRNDRFPDGLLDKIKDALRHLEAKTGQGFGNTALRALVHQSWRGST